MGKTDWKAEAKALKKKVRKLKDSLTAAAGPVAEAVSDAVEEVVVAEEEEEAVVVEVCYFIYFTIYGE